MTIYNVIRPDPKKIIVITLYPDSGHCCPLPLALVLFLVNPLLY